MAHSAFKSFSSSPPSLPSTSRTYSGGSRTQSLMAGLFFACCLALFAVVGWEPGLLAPAMSGGGAIEQRAAVADALQRRQQTAGVVRDNMLNAPMVEARDVQPNANATPHMRPAAEDRAAAPKPHDDHLLLLPPRELDATKPPVFDVPVKARPPPPRRPRAPPAGGNTHKGIGTLIGLDSNNDIVADPLFAEMVEDKCALAETDYLARAVAAQLAPWRKVYQDADAQKDDTRPPIQIKHLDMQYCMRKQVARISYVNGVLRHASWQLNMDFNRLRQSMWFLRLATLRAERRGDPIPDFEILLNPTDKTAGYARGGTEELTEEPLPLFCNAKCEGDSSISFPIMFNAQLGGAGGEMALPLYAAKYSELEALGIPVPWREKKPTLFFSGTNMRGNRAAIYKSRSPHITALLEVVPIADYGYYRYLIYAFGHSGWSQRLRELALMDAVVLMEESRCREFYQLAFEANKDYVPVREDLDDLDEKIAAAVADEAGSEAMARRWREKGRKALSLPCVLDYIEALLREYVTRTDFVPAARPEWPEYHLNATPSHFMNKQPPPVEVCRDFF